MPMIGEVEEREEGVFEWTVRDFMSLPDQVDDRYDSPSFYFGGARWHLVMYPNGERNKSEGYTGVFLGRQCSGSPILLIFYLGLKTTNNEIFQGTRTTDDSEEACNYVGMRFRRSRIFLRQSELVPSGHLTIVCRMEHVESTEAAKAVPATTNSPAIDKIMPVTSSKSARSNSCDIIEIDETKPMTSSKSTKLGL